MKLIDKDILITEIERRLEAISSSSNDNNRELAVIRGAQQFELINLTLFINTLDVKEVDEHDDVDLDIICEEMGVEPDSRIASMFKNAFYKAVDKFLEKKENKL